MSITERMSASTDSDRRGACREYWRAKKNQRKSIVGKSRCGSKFNWRRSKSIWRGVGISRAVCQSLAGCESAAEGQLVHEL